MICTEHTRFGRRPRRATAVAVALLLALATVGCSDDDADDTDAAATSTAPAGTTDDGPGALENCSSRMPGEALTAAEAVVLFSTEAMCPAYVTVVGGTPITWVNRDTTARTVRIIEGPTEDGELIEEIELDPDEQAERTYTDPGYLTFVTDALPDARGTIEVQATAGESPLDAE